MVPTVGHCRKEMKTRRQERDCQQLAGAWKKQHLIKPSVFVPRRIEVQILLSDQMNSTS